ncbi:MAG: addiction module protein [Ignavibacteria bacterium RBG_16_34_14]|nr:MAG: addiction module protein [Ignavibacteria bacterium RBG_16_34_14]
MSVKEIIKQIDKLDLSEKLILVEDIWDSIARSNSVLPLYEWQKNELDKRYKEYKNGEQTLHEWNEVHEELRKKYK